MGVGGMFKNIYIFAEKILQITKNIEKTEIEAYENRNRKCEKLLYSPWFSTTYFSILLASRSVSEVCIVRFFSREKHLASSCNMQIAKKKKNSLLCFTQRDRMIQKWKRFRFSSLRWVRGRRKREERVVHSSKCNAKTK